MKAELRIGNYVKCVDGNTICIDKDDMIYILSNTFEVEPIPLTEEMMLKCGAVLHGIEYIIKASALPIKIRFHSGIAYCELGNVYLGDRIKYLHELQNLKYAICGLELEVSL